VRTQVVAEGGRGLAVESWGPEDGYPILYLHGMPGSRRGPRPLVNHLYNSGLRLIAYDRPGYGGSGRLEGRSVSHAAADVASIADALGIETFSVMGRSGGGPHAMACAALLPDRVQNVAILVSLAPFDADPAELDWFGGMTPSNIHAFTLAAEDHGSLHEELLQRHSALNSDPQQMIRSLVPEMSPGDRRIVWETGVRRMLVQNFDVAFDPDEADADARDHGLQGWFDDVVSLVKPWGFQLSDIEVPALLWQGELDTFSPMDHFYWLADHIKNATTMLALDTAHFGAIPAMPRILRWLANTANPAGAASRR
jgi:pimeloyl-ACP methyl ester carboxylesterase